MQCQKGKSHCHRYMCDDDNDSGIRSPYWRVFAHDETRYDATDMTNPSDNAGVRVPPPLLYELAVFGGYLLNRQWPLAVGAGAIINVLASALALAGLPLAVSSVGKLSALANVDCSYPASYGARHFGPVSVHAQSNVCVFGGDDDCSGPLFQQLVGDVAVGGRSGHRACIRHRSGGAVSSSPVRSRLRRLYASSAALGMKSRSSQSTAMEPIRRLNDR